MTKVRLIQVESNESEPVATRIARVLSEIPAHTRHADLVVLPELWHVGAFNLAGAREHAEAIDGPLVTALAAIARETQTWLHGGSIAIKNATGQIFNTAVLFGPDGNLVATYQKQHLFGFADGERTVITAGESLSVVETPLGRTGLATCYDLRFPELFRGLVDSGAQTFLLCSGWPTPRINHWQVLTQARAIENQAFMIACNGRGSHAGITLGGYSVVVDPKGNVIAQANSADDYVDAVIDIAIVEQWRADFPVLADRRNL